MKVKTLLSIFFIFILSLILCLFMFNKKINSFENQQFQLYNNTLSMMLETEADSGNYEKVTQSSWPKSGYKFNSTLSKCENGSEVSWNNEKKSITLSGNMTDKCFVYFDKVSLKLALNDYTFSWDEVEGASSYQIYSDGELLTTTSSTNAEIYGLYNDAGTYSITVKALNSSNEVIIDSNKIAYNLEKTVSNDGFMVLNPSNYYEPDCSMGPGIEGDCYIYEFNLIYQGGQVSYSINDQGYYVNLFDFQKYLDNNNVVYTRIHSSTFNIEEVNISPNYCSNNNCENYKLSNLNMSLLSGNNSIVGNVCYENAAVLIKQTEIIQSFYIYAIQLVEPGKIPSDWKLIGARFQCLSSKTEVYVYDKKKKKFKKKKIGDIDYDDEILCWDFDKGEFAVSKPIWIKKCEQANKYNLLKFSDGSTLETIDQHRIYNKEAGKFTYPMTDDTPIGTTTFNSNGEYVKLVSKEVIEKPIDYYNIITEYHINLFANDILTSSRLSNMYRIENMKYVYEEKRDNGYDLSKYDEKLINGLRLKEQNIEESKLKTYVDNMLKLMKK